MPSSEPNTAALRALRLLLLMTLAAGFALPLTPLIAAPAARPPLLQQHEAMLEALTPAQQQEFGQHLAAWNALPRAEREERRARYLAWLQLQPAERTQLHALAAQVAAFPPARAQALRAQFDALEEVQRRGWRLGPSLGRDYAALFPLLAYVPQGQQQPLLARLRGLDAAQRADMGVLVQRTPPQERAALREELLKVPPASLAGWLKHKLDQ
ncbi:MAG: DUF3106 domain-containing protein [Pseudoxanthomonas sp.]